MRAGQATALNFYDTAYSSSGQFSVAAAAAAAAAAAVVVCVHLQYDIILLLRRPRETAGLLLGWYVYGIYKYDIILQSVSYSSSVTLLGSLVFAGIANS